MDNNELERRKHIRRQHRKCKDIDKVNRFKEFRDEQKIKKQFKNQKQQLLGEELWEEWQDEIS